MLFVAGLMAIGVGVLAYRQMDDGGRCRCWPTSSPRCAGTPRPRRLAGGGVLIAFEGGEGAGKSTQVRRLQEWLTSEGLVSPGDVRARGHAVGRGHPGDRPGPGAHRHRRALGGAALRRRPGPARARRPAAGARRRGGRDHRSVRRQLAGLPGCRPHDPARRRPDAVPLGHPGPATRPHRAARPAARDGLARARGRAVADRLESESLEFHQRVRQNLRALAEAQPDR